MTESPNSTHPAENGKRKAENEDMYFLSSSSLLFEVMDSR